jgi:hypothetical protein
MIWITSNLNSEKEMVNYQDRDDDRKFCVLFVFVVKLPLQRNNFNLFLN